MTAKTIQELEALKKENALLKTPPLASASSTAGNSLFAKTAELRATLAKIRAIEASNLTLAKYPATSFPTGNLCNKKDLITAQKHLATIAHKSPAKASTARPAPTTATAKGRSASAFMALAPDDREKLIRTTCTQNAGASLRKEIRAAYDACPQHAKADFFRTYKTSLTVF